MSGAQNTHVLAAEVGTLFAGRPRSLSMARVRAFSGGPFDIPGWPDRNIHTDLNKAKKAGLENVIASGTQSEGILIGHLLRICGFSWHQHGKLDVRFVKSVPVGEMIFPFVRLTAARAEGEMRELEFEVWCNNASDVTVIVGSASCSIRQRAAESQNND